MSGSNRSGNSKAIDWAFPLTGIIIAIALAWGVGWLQAREEYNRQQTPKAYAEAAKKDAERACIGIDPRAVFECVSEKAETAYQTAHDEQDLSAQQRAASSALITAVLSFLALVLSGFGVWFVKKTLDATLAAVEDTGRATEAMERQNELVVQAQRPWLTIQARITLAKKTSTGIKLRFEAKITNIGNTVADRCAVRGGFIEKVGVSPGNAINEIRKFRRDAENMASILEDGPRMPYPIVPGETKTITAEIAVSGELPVYELRKGVYRTTYSIFVCARYHLPGESILRVTDRAFSVDYMPDPDDVFAPFGIPVPLPDELSADNVILRPGGYNATT